MLRHDLIRAAIGGLSLAAPGRWPAARDCAGFVLTLHRVHSQPPAAFAPNAVLSISVGFLDRFLAHLSAQRWRFVSLDELIDGDPDPRRIAITLDDGFRDNAVLAAPIFRKHGAPFTIYVCTSFSDRTEPLWWEALEQVIAGAQQIPAPKSGATLATRTVAEKNRAFHVWRSWIIGEATDAEGRRAVLALCAACGFDPLAQTAELVMDWDDVRGIARDPLCSIGAHTLTHPVLARLPPDDARREITASGERIEAEIGVRPTSIAFPYGFRSAAGVREAQLAEEAGYVSSVTTRPGYVAVGGARHGLPRVSVNGLFEDTRTYDVLLSSGLWTLAGRVRGRARTGRVDPSRL